MKHKLFSCIIIAMAAMASIECSCTKDDDYNSYSNDGGTSTGGDSGTADDSNSPTLDSNITAYDGETADDAENDVAGTDEDIYREANTFSDTVKVVYSDASATVTTTNSNVLTYVSGAYVTVDMQTNEVKNVCIVASGTSSDGQLKIYGAKKFQLTLNGLDLTCTKGPAINDQCKKRCFVYLPDGTTNRLTDASTYSTEPYYLSTSSESDEDRKGCFFSEGNLIFSGSGVLVVKGNYKHGIATDGYFYTRPGVTIAVTQAAKNCIQVNGDTDDGIGINVTGGLIYACATATAGKAMKTDLNVDISGGKLLLNTSGGSEYDSDEQDTSSPSCIKADGNVSISGGTLTLKSTGKGGKGIKADGTLQVSGGTTNVTTTGGKYTYSSELTASPKGVRADGDITISGGNLNIEVTGQSDGSEGLESKSKIAITGGYTYIYAYDDAMNAATDINISGGRVYCYAINNDGIDSNGSLTISGGLVIGVGTSAPESGIDCDNSNNFKINGGTVISMGGTLQSSPSSSSSQRSVVCNGVSASKDSYITILNSSSTPILTFKYPRTLSGASLLFSSPDITSGASYTISSGGSISSYTDSWNNWYSGGTWSDGSALSTFTASSVVTTIGNSTGGGGGDQPGGGGGGQPGGGGGRW